MRGPPSTKPSLASASVDGEPILVENAKDGTVLVLVPDGEFLAGGTGSNKGRSAAFSVRLPAYYLALYPVTNVQYARFLTAVQPSKADLEKWISLDGVCFVRATTPGYGPYGGKDDHPVVQVSWYGAMAYCEWAGLRLPTELEWERGARGTDGREYPWGAKWEPQLCRNNPNHGSETTAPVSAYAAGASPSGAYQMSGNVWEWCVDKRDSRYYDRLRESGGDPSKAGAQKGGAPVPRGGSWFDDVTARFRCADRYDLVPSWRFHVAYGFRAARTF